MLVHLGREVPRLDILLYHSFAYPLLQVEPSRLRKVFGVVRGMEIQLVNGGAVEVKNARGSDAVVKRVVEELMGCWCSAYNTFSNVSEKIRRRIRELVKVYSWMGVSTSSLDDVALFAAIALSRNTDFHRNVVSWMRKLLSRFDDISEVANLSEDSVVSIVGAASYQLRQLPAMLRAYLEARAVISEGRNPSRVRYVRRVLMSRIPFAGPKVVDSVLLFIVKNPLYAPVDKNLVKFIELMDLVDVLGTRVPEKSLCLKYDCDACPKRSDCISNLGREAMGRFFAVFQSIAYTHIGLWCRRELCSECPLRGMCRRS